jgi:hypothetical protein
LGEKASIPPVSQPAWAHQPEPENQQFFEPVPEGFIQREPDGQPPDPPSTPPGNAGDAPPAPPPTDADADADENNSPPPPTPPGLGPMPNTESSFPPNRIDWFEMSRPYLNRGAPWLRMDANSGVEEQWQSSFRFFRNLGFNDTRATWLSNQATPIAIDTQLAPQLPTRWEQMDREMGTSSTVVAPTLLRFKLEVSQPGDEAEQEADAVAEKIVSGEGLSASGEKTFVPKARAVQASGNDPIPDTPPQAYQVLAQPGEPLPPSVRRQMETSFGANLGSVRIHADGAAANASQQLHARAFTAGEHIVFGANQFDTHSTNGIRLLAHELVHVMQQREGNLGLQREIINGEPHDDGFTPLMSNATSNGALFQDLMSRLTPGGGEHHAFVLSQFGLAVYHIPTGRIVQRYPPRVTEGRMPSGIYVFGTGGSFDIYGMRNGEIIHRGVRFDPNSGFSPERLAIVRARRSMVIIEDFVDVTVAELNRNHYLPAHAIAGEVAETSVGGEAPSRPAAWAEDQVSSVRRRLAGTPSTGTGTGDRAPADSSTTPSHPPERLVCWVRQDGRQFVNVWVNGAVQTLELFQNQTTEELQSRVSAAATQLFNTRDPNQSTTIADGAQETGFAEPTAESRPQRELSGSGAPMDIDPEQQRLMIQNGERGANLPPYPARINNYGTSVSVTGGNNRMAMEIDYSIAGSDTLSQVAARFQYINYFWEIFDVTNVEVPAPGTEHDLSGSRPGEHSTAINPGSGVGNEMSRDFSNIWEDQRADLLEMADAGLLNIPLWQFRAAQLSLMAVSSVVRSIGTLVSSYVSIVTTPLNERNIGWDQEGEFLVRCVATPASEAEDRYRRASSIAVVPIKVMNVNTRATTELERPEAELRRLREQLERLPEGPRRNELVEQITGMERARDQTTMQNVAEQVTNARTQVAAVDEIIANRASGAHPSTMSVEARILRVQIELNGLDPAALRERLQEQLNLLLEMQTYGNTQVAAMQGATFKPRVVLASEENGSVFQMVMVLGELSNSNARRRRYRLVDMSSPATQDYYDGESTLAGDAGISEAVKNAFIRFRENNGYGRGTIAVQLPPGLDPSGTVPRIMRSAPGSRERWMQRLRDLATAAEVAGLVLTGPAGMAIGLLGGAAGAITAIDSMMRRSHGGRLRWDFQTFMDITAIVGGTVPFAGLSRRYERAVYYFGIAQLGQSALVIPIELFHQLEAIEQDASLPPGERRARQAEAFLGAIRSGVVTVVSARQMLEHGPPPPEVENAPVAPVSDEHAAPHPDEPQVVEVPDAPTPPRTETAPHPDEPTPEGGSPRPTPEPEETANPEEGRRPRPHAPTGEGGSTPSAANRLKIRVNELLAGTSLSEHPDAETRATQRQAQIEQLLNTHPDLIQLGHECVVEIAAFAELRRLVRDSFFGETTEHNTLAREALQRARMRLADHAMADAVQFIADTYPNLTANLLDMGTPGFGSDRDVTIQFRGPEGSLNQQIDASLQAVRRAYDILRRAGLEPDAVLDTNFYTELHESSITPANAHEAARLVFDQSVASLAEMRMHMSDADWTAYRDQQLQRLSTAEDATSAQGRMEADARTRMEAEFAAAEALATELRPQGQTAAQREALLAARRQALSDALRRGASGPELRRLMAEIKLLEPEAYGTRAAVESVVGRQQTWARGDSTTYMREGRSLPAGGSERLAFLVQDASANTALLHGHTQPTGNSMSMARAAAKYLARVFHSVVQDGGLGAGAHEAIQRNLHAILDTKSIVPAAEGEARAIGLMRESLRQMGTDAEAVNAMTNQQVQDAYVNAARRAATSLLINIRTMEQMSHAAAEPGVPSGEIPSPPTAPPPTDSGPSGTGDTPSTGAETPTESAPSASDDRPTIPPPGRAPRATPAAAPERVNRSTDQVYWVYDSSNPRFSSRAELENGILTITLRTVLDDGSRSSILRGAEEFSNIMAHFGAAVQAIKGSWQFGTNLATINSLTAAGMPLEQAVRQTWSATQAARFGFSAVTITEPTAGSRPEGGYTTVKALFTRPTAETLPTEPTRPTTPIANPGEEHNRD